MLAERGEGGGGGRGRITHEWYIDTY